MPTYVCPVPAGSLTITQKTAVVEAIARIHSEATGAPQFFVQVIIDENQSVDRFLGGQLTTGWQNGRTEREVDASHYERCEPNRRGQRGLDLGLSLQPRTDRYGRIRSCSSGTRRRTNLLRKITATSEKLSHWTSDPYKQLFL